MKEKLIISRLNRLIQILETEEEFDDTSIFTSALTGAIQALQQQEWISVDDRLPDELETVWITNGKGWTTLGCRVCFDNGWHWAGTNGVIYEERGKIVSECESDDLDVKFWHSLPTPPNK